MAEDEGKERAFAYVVAEKAPTYRAVMRAFVEAKERFALHMRPDEVARAVGVDAAEVEQALKQLESWGNLVGSPDTADVATVEDFYRERRLYQLSRQGEAAERALQVFEKELLAPGELQAAALDDIRALLGQLEHLDAEDAGKAHQTLEQLFRRFEELTSKAQVFLGALRRSIDLHGSDEEAFLIYKDRLIDYLERFVRELITASVEIRRAIDRVEARGVDELLVAAARRHVQDQLEDADDTERWRARWVGLRHWFHGSPGHPAQANLLRQRAVTAIPVLLSAVEAIHDRRVRRTDRYEDWRTLARWFAEAPTEDDAHRLYRAAFCLSPARHLRINYESLSEMGERMNAPLLSWLDVPTLRLTPRLRTTGRHSRRGAERKVVDRSEARKKLAELADREARQVEAARRQLVVGRVRLSELGELDEAGFDLFLELLAAALGAQVDPRAPVDAVSIDGAFRVRLEPIGDGSRATVRAPSGALTGPDCWLEIGEARTELPEAAE